MSLSATAQRAQKLDTNVAEYFQELYEKALPKTLDDIQSFEALKRGDADAQMTDRMTNMVFKNETLLKSAKRKLKERKKRKNETEIDLECEDEIAHDEQPREEHESNLVHGFQETGRSFIYVKKFSWNAEAVNDLITRAKNHHTYLRRMRGKTWDKLTFLEQNMINEYLQKQKDFAARLQSGCDYMDYQMQTCSLYTELYDMLNEAQEDTENTIIEDRPVKIRRLKQLDAPPDVLPVPPPSQIASSSNSQPEVQIETMRSYAHERAAILLRDIEKIVHHYLNIYGAIRGSGRVVEKPEVSVASPPLIESEMPQDFWKANDLMCNDCGIMRIIHVKDACATCPSCAKSVPYQDFGDKSFNFNEKPELDNVKKKNYDPKNYAQRWIASVQGKLGKIPDEVRESLFAAFYKQRLKKVTNRIVRQNLQRLGLSCYYKHVPQLTYEFNEVPLPKFTEEEEYILCTKMFNEYREAFSRCPMDIRQRNNLMSYPYYFRQAVRIRGWDHYCKCFPLLDGDRHLRKHDKTWKWICENKEGEKWKFYPTV